MHCTHGMWAHPDKCKQRRRREYSPRPRYRVQARAQASALAPSSAPSRVVGGSHALMLSSAQAE